MARKKKNTEEVIEKIEEVKVENTKAEEAVKEEKETKKKTVKKTVKQETKEEKNLLKRNKQKKPEIHGVENKVSPHVSIWINCKK